MRIVVAAVLLCLSSSAFAAGTKPRQISSASSIKEGQGVVAISIRSEIFLPGMLDVYFLREGGSVDNNKDVVRFSRRQSMLAIRNDTTDYAVKTFSLPPGRYHLVAHGMDCPSVPPPGMTCAVTISVNGMKGGTISRPSKGYSGETPAFDVEAGKLTLIGDLLLSEDNTLLWSTLPDAEIEQVKAKFGELSQAADPIVPEVFLLQREIRPSGMFQNMGREY